MNLRPVRHSNLKAMAQSPAHYWYRLEHGIGRKRTISVGSAAHAMILGGAKIVTYPGKVRNGKFWKAFQEDPAHAGAIILLESETRAAEGIARAVEQCRAAVELLEGEHEAELPIWTISGRECGGRPDVTSDRFVTELKTGTTSEPNRFVRHSLRMAWPGQIAWYLDGIEANGGGKRDGFIVAVEQTAPYVVTPFQVEARALDLGRRTNRLWLERLLACEAADEWPGYAQSIVPLDVPEYEDEIELDFGEEPEAKEFAA